MSFRHTIRAVIAAVALVGAQHAHAWAVLDFQNLTCAKTQELCGAGDTYTASGFTLQYAPAADEPYPVGFTAVGKQWRFNVKGSIALEANSCSATTTLTRTNGVKFSLLSIDLAEVNGDGLSSVTFIGTKSDGSQVSASVNLDGKIGWQRVQLPRTFTNLSSVTWTQGDCILNKPHMFDNVFVN